MTLKMFQNLKKVNEKLIDVGTGGFLKYQIDGNMEEEEKNGQAALRPVMTQTDQENIKQKLVQIDQLLTRECVLCGEFLLDLVGSAVVPDGPETRSDTLKGQHSYKINLKTGEAHEQV